MRPRIAIPLPHSERPDYNERTWPQYARAVEACGGEAVAIPLDGTPEEIARQAAECHAVLLPGSPADVDPQKYSQPRHPHTSAADPKRDNVDELLLQDAYHLHKPVLGICYGLQSLNVWRSGTLVQHIESEVNHEAGKHVPIAHAVKLEPQSRLAAILEGAGVKGAELPVNSSHHQSPETVGDGLKAVARSQDGVIEALEGSNPAHFVLGVQWHPERGFEQDRASRAIFESFTREAAAYARQEEKDKPSVIRDDPKSS